MRNLVEHIFFDLDHTLWDFDKNSRLAFQRMFQYHGITVNLEDFLTIYEPINFQYWKLYREEKVTKQQLRRGRFAEAFRPFGIHYNETDLDDLANSYIVELPKDNHLFKGVMEILEYLSPNYYLHIITNGFQEVQHLKLQNSGISAYFNTVTTSEEVGLKKPHPVIFKKALEKAKAAPAKSLMVVDTFEADILGAEAVWMHTLFFNYRKDKIPEHYVKIDDISEIKKHL